MREQMKSLPIGGYIARSLGVLVLLAVLSFLTAGFSVRSMPFSLAGWGALAFIYGLAVLGHSGPVGDPVTAVKDMHGQAGANPLANYASQHEYKLVKLREEHPSAEESDEQDEGGGEDDLRWAACVVAAGLLALGSAWFVGRIFP